VTESDREKKEEVERKRLLWKASQWAHPELKLLFLLDSLVGSVA
jgi:hypothetical protein